MGTGIPRVLRECVDYGLPEPQLIDFDGDFRVNMYRKQKKESTLETTKTIENPTQSPIQSADFQFTEKDKEILKVIQQNPELTQREIALELGWTVDRVKYYLNKIGKQVTEEGGLLPWIRTELSRSVCLAVLPRQH